MLLVSSAQNVAHKNQPLKVLGRVQSAVRKLPVNSVQNAVHQDLLLKVHGNVQNAALKSKANSAQNVAQRDQKKNISNVINVVGNQVIQITFQSSAQNAVIQSTTKIRNSLWQMCN
jgi:hypothetical protein